MAVCGGRCVCVFLFNAIFVLINILSEAQARRGEEPDVDPEQFQDPDNEYGLFAGTTYEADDEEADKIYDQVDQTMDQPACPPGRGKGRGRTRKAPRRAAKNFSNSSLI